MVAVNTLPHQYRRPCLLAVGLQESTSSLASTLTVDRSNSFKKTSLHNASSPSLSRRRVHFQVDQFDEIEAQVIEYSTAAEGAEDMHLTLEEKEQLYDQVKNDLKELKKNQDAIDTLEAFFEAELDFEECSQTLRSSALRGLESKVSLLLRLHRKWAVETVIECYWKNENSPDVVSQRCIEVSQRAVRLAQFLAQADQLEAFEA